MNYLLLLQIPLMSMSAVAHAGALEIGYASKIETGQSPTMMITSKQPIIDLQVTIEYGDDMKRHRFDDISAGTTQSISWERDTNVTSAMAYILAEFSDNSEEEMQVAIHYTYGGGLSVDLSEASADLEEHTLSVNVTSFVEYVEVIAWGAGKEQLDSQTFSVQDGPGKITIPWVGRASEVVLLDITLHNTSGWAGFTFSPWFLDIPHDDVHFDTNTANIPTAEEYKLFATLKELNDVIVKYGEIVPVKLYIAGCTDTVGDKASNKGLSERRARAIAKWLRGHGYTMPIYYYGFGESLLAVPTPDSTENSRNRRALYMVGANPPPTGSGVPSVRWRAL
jgi:outer membrane protein OmpA-like peptidoglycan-associated protein